MAISESSSSGGSSSDAVASLSNMVQSITEAAQESLGATVTSTVTGPSTRRAGGPYSSSSPPVVSLTTSNSSRSNHNNGLSTLTAAAGLTTSLAVGLWLLQAWLAAPEAEGNHNNSHWWRKIFATETLWRLLGLRPRQQQEPDSKTVALHRGSCQCGAITFKLTPPRRVPLLENYRHLGKQQYPAARVPADQLQLTSGKHLWSSYHVSSPQDDAVWAFSFCRVCSTQLLHATEKDQSSLFVNVTCFKQVALEEQQRQSVASGTRRSSSDSSKPQIVTTGSDNNSQAWDDISVGTTGTALPYFADPRLFASPSMVATAVPNNNGSSRSLSGSSWKAASQQQNSDLSTYLEGSRDYDDDDDDDEDDEHIGQNVLVNDTGDYDSILSSRSPTELSASQPNTNKQQPFSSTSLTAATTAASSSVASAFSQSNNNNNNSTAVAAIDYNVSTSRVSTSREAMLYNMRKHLRDSSTSMDEKKINVP